MMAAKSASDRPLVDVCVVSWNTAELTAEALRRLLDSDQGCTLRLLVRDNASSDGTLEILKERVPEAEVDAGSQNLGFAGGVNTLLARSTAPWILLLNSDAWPEAGAIGKLVDSARARPRAAAVAPRLERPDGSLEHSTFPFPSLRLAMTMAFWRQRLSVKRAEDLLLEDAWQHDKGRPVDWAVGAALLLRKEAVAAIGGFDESFFMYVEDLEWCWRASRQGWEVYFEPSALVRHLGNASGMQRYGDRRIKVQQANAYRFFAREHGQVAALAYRALNLAGSGIRYVAARRSGDEQLAHYWRIQVAANLVRANKRRQ